MHILSRLTKRAFLLATLMLLSAGGVDLNAQTFQYTHGNPSCRDAGRGIVNAPGLTGGGFLSVGESFNGVGCTNSDVYVVRTNDDGTLAWSNTYDLQGTDSATAVVACANGDFVITGVTTGATGGRDLFLLRISSTGAVVAQNVFGHNSNDEYGTAVIETASGNGTTTNIGDIVVVGWISINGQRDAWIMRTRANLTQIWNVVLRGIFPNDRDDYFHDVIEQRTQPGVSPLLAVGGTSSWGAGGTDLFAARFTDVGNFLQSRVIGGADNDEAHAVAEVPNGLSIGDVAIIGNTRSRPGALGANLDVYVIATDATVTGLRSDVLFGTPLLDSEGMDIDVDNVQVTNPMRFIATGYTNTGGGSLLRENVFLQRLTFNAGALSGAGMIYGGLGNDRGWSLTPTGPVAAAGQPTTPGYAIVGYTQSSDLIGGDPEQMYTIKTDSFLVSGCNELEVSFGELSPGWRPVSVTPSQLALISNLILDVVRLPQDWSDELCSTPAENLVTRERGNGGSEDGNGGAGAVAGFTAMGAEPAGTMYPNPLRSGEPLAIRFGAGEPVQATITVTDMLGRTVAQIERSYGAGTTIELIETRSWPAGTYVVAVSAGQIQSSRTVTITK